jgi:hypothetical protein
MDKNGRPHMAADKGVCQKERTKSNSVYRKVAIMADCAITLKGTISDGNGCWSWKIRHNAANMRIERIVIGIVLQGNFVLSPFPS